MFFTFLYITDIAATSIEQCETRYNSDKMRGRHRQPLFDAEFHTADCTRVSDTETSNLLSKKFCDFIVQMQVTVQI